MNIKIVKTNHIRHEGNSETRNYYIVYYGNNIEKDIIQFYNKHKSQNGLSNIAVFSSEWSANIEDYKELTGLEYIRYADEHYLFCIAGKQFLYSPMKDSVYEVIKQNEEKYRSMTYSEIFNEINNVKEYK